MKCSYCKISHKDNALILSLCRAGPGTLDSACGECCSHFCSVLRRRLPDGYLFQELQPYRWEFSHCLRVTASRLLYVFSAYFLGRRLSPKRHAVGELRPPYPPLYHFTSAANRDSILAQGLVSDSGRVFMTNWQDLRWIERFNRWKKFDEIICFQIDAGRLIRAGHRISVYNVFHEYFTDYVPPDCLTLTDLRVVRTVGNQ